MVTPYGEMRRLAVEKEKIWQERNVKKYEEMKRLAEKGHDPCCDIHQLQKTLMKKDYKAELPDYEIEDEDQDVMNEHKEPCEQCEKLQNEGKEVPDAGKDKKGKKGQSNSKSPEKVQKPAQDQSKKDGKKDDEEIVCDDCKAAKKAK